MVKIFFDFISMIRTTQTIQSHTQHEIIVAGPTPNAERNATTLPIPISHNEALRQVPVSQERDLSVGVSGIVAV